MSGLKETIKNNRLVRYSYYFARGIAQRGKLEARALRTLDDLHVPRDSVDVADMLRMNRRYGFEFDEYISFGFAHKSMKERLAYVADWEHLGYTCAMNDPQNAEIFDNKWVAYQTFRPWYGREMKLFRDSSEKDAFVSFFTERGQIVTKPLAMSAGRGVEIHDISDWAGRAEELFRRLMKQYNGCFVAEERIIQHPETAKFHPSSVNTVRAAAVRLDDETVLIHPFLRLGQHGKCVDNAGAGGIVCVMDADTGVVYAAADKRGNRYECHPDTGETLVGFAIPRWDEAKELVKTLAQVVPSNRYAGWDLALTENGWIMVEANRRGQFGGWQSARQIGFREEINGLLKRLGKKY